MSELDRGQTIPGKLGKSDEFDLFYFFPDDPAYGVIELRQTEVRKK